MVFSSTDFDCHERVVYCYDQPSGLKAIIAIHNTSRGPTLGGSRAWYYSSESEALRDVLRLSRGMTYKAAMANLPLGGGKAVIMLPEGQKSPSDEMLRRFGDAIEGLSGHYITAEDVGTTTANMEVIRERTQHVVGLPRSAQGGSGNPSILTAYGTWRGIQAAIAHQLGQDDLKGIRVAVQGVGSVGAELCRLLHESGASLVMTDVNEEALEEVVQKYGAQSVSIDEIYDADVDVFSPCALGATLNSETIPRL
ncbi:MAG: Glu/Leu/Phe/Val dehydrogenase, partial [bacterium]|nr:Glu/Leu/Phe/Val dehydrogenase [bacterium]